MDNNETILIELLKVNNGNTQANYSDKDRIALMHRLHKKGLLHRSPLISSPHMYSLSNTGKDFIKTHVKNS